MSQQAAQREAAAEARKTSARIDQRFRVSDREVTRELVLRSGRIVTSGVGLASGRAREGLVDVDVADKALLQRRSLPTPGSGPPVGVVDLFAGVGGLSQGIAEASRAVGAAAHCFGVDSDPTAIATYQRNLPDGRGICADVSDVFDGRLGGRTTASERAFRDLVGHCEVLLGGPPCQGHSAFNNRTRHSDRRNELYLTMVRAAEVLEPEHVVIENVPGALRDRSSVVQRSMDALAALGYSLGGGVVDMARIGVPQLRRRLLVLASHSASCDVEEVVRSHGTRTRSVRWAIGDLVGIEQKELFDMAARSAPQTRERIDVLFDQGLWDLPNEHRPQCHAHGDHSYGSIYGRLDWKKPAQTITTGFYSMCMGRYVHPSERRTITAHEAARLQFIPDYVDFGQVGKRGELARLIGNAVPVKLGYLVGVELLG